MKWKKGDIVSILGTLMFDQDKDDPEGRIHIDIIGSFEKLWIEPKHLTLVTPLFEVGDKCKWGGAPGSPPTEPMRGTILAISGDFAWIDMGTAHCTRPLTSIERVDDETEL